MHALAYRALAWLYGLCSPAATGNHHRGQDYAPAEPAPADLEEYPESWGGYPAPHYDEYDDCECPDHRAQRSARLARLQAQAGPWYRGMSPMQIWEDPRLGSSGDEPHTDV